MAFPSEPLKVLSLGDWLVLSLGTFAGKLKRGDVANVYSGGAVDFEV